MIRAVAVLSLVTLLILVLYVPSAHSPERFASQLRTEREAAVAYWGSDPATRMLDRAIRMQETIADVTPIPAAKDALSTASVNDAVSRAETARFMPSAPSTSGFSTIPTFAPSMLCSCLPAIDYPQ